jgi:GT2 family glycosyltransferase
MSRPLDPGRPEEFRAGRHLDVLIPTRNRPAELAATLSGLAAQDDEFGVVVADQSDGAPVWRGGAVAGLVRILRHRRHPVLLCRNLPLRGVAQQRAFLLDRSAARYVLFLDDDVWLEPGSVSRMVTAIEELRCGFVGNFPHGLSYVDDHRPAQEKAYREWTGRPHPERIRPRGPQWQRAELHAAANLLHLTERLDLAPGQWRAYEVSWLGACVLYDRAALVDTGGYDFWARVPADSVGEDVAAQLRVLAHSGGAGLLPSGAYHLESPTTLPERGMECFDDPLFGEQFASATLPASMLPEGQELHSAALPEGQELHSAALPEGQELRRRVDDLDGGDVGDERG